MQTYGKTSTVKDGEIPVNLLKTATGQFAEADFGAFGLWLDSPADADRGIRAFALAKSLLLGKTSEPIDMAAISRAAARKTARDLLDELPSSAGMDGAGPYARSPYFWIGRLRHAVASLLEAEAGEPVPEGVTPHRTRRAPGDEPGSCGGRPYAAGSEGDDGTECVLPAGHDGPHDDGPVPPAAELVPCKSVSGSASCSRLEGHELPHRNLGGIEWEDTAADYERKFIAPVGERCQDAAGHPADDEKTLICCKSAGHLTAHYDHIDQAFWSVAADGHVTVAPMTFADGSRM